MPKIADAQPITTPTSDSSGRPGTRPVAFGRRSKPICTAIAGANTPMIFCSIGLDRRGQAAQRRAEQDAEGHPEHHRPAHRTQAMVGEDRVDRRENDGRQRGSNRQWVRMSQENPCALKLNTSTGTMISPPPTQTGQHSGEAASSR